MKKLLIILSVIIVSSCTALFTVPELIIDEALTTREDCIQWVADNTTYEVSEWNVQTPNETISLGTGDCLDYSLLAIYLVYYYTGEKMNLVNIDIPDEISIYTHAIISSEDGTQFFEPQRNGNEIFYIEPVDILKIIPYADAMRKASYIYYLDGKE